MYDRTNHDETGLRPSSQCPSLQLPLQARPVERSATFTPRSTADAPGVDAAAVPWKSILGGALDLLPF